MALVASHIYTTIRFECYRDTWQGETWQTGIRTAVDFVSGPWSFDQERRTPSPFDVKVSGTAQTWDDWAIQRGWSGAQGPGLNAITDNDKNDIVTQVTELLTATKGQQCGAYRLADIRMYAIGPDGKSLTAPDIYTDTKNRFVGTGKDTLPPEMSIAISTQSVWRGPSGRGRMFYGGLGTNTLDTNGLIKAASGTVFATAGKHLFDGIRAINTGVPAGSASFTPIIWSKSGGKNTAPNTAVAIRAVRVGDEFDTQRRREQGRRDVYQRLDLE